MEYIAHRGESLIAPENTLESFALAWARGANGIEGDFHLLKDGHIVCMHDDNVQRTSGVKRMLEEMTLPEVKALDVGSWKDDVWKHTKVPTLEEILVTVPDYGKILIEIKCKNRIVSVLNTTIQSSKLRDEQFVIITFSEDTLIEAKRLMPEVKALLLTDLKFDKESKKISPTPEELVEKLQDVGADGVDCCAHDFLTRAYINEVKKAGLEFHVWTINEVEKAKKFIEFEVDSITSDCAYILARETE